MILFFILAAALVAVALLMLLPPLFGKSTTKNDQTLIAELKKRVEAAQTEAERATISAELLEVLEQHNDGDSRDHNPLIPLLVAFFVPILATGIYLKVGSPGLVTKTPQTAANQAPHEKMPDIGELITKLQERLVEDPNDAEGWYLLARTLMSTQEYQKAATAMGKVIELTGEDDPNLLVQYADSLSMAAQGNLLGEPLSYVEKALSLNPDHPEALWLRGIGYTQQDKLAEAVITWKKAIRNLGERPEAQAELRQMIADTELNLAKGIHRNTVASEDNSALGTGASIAVSVSLNPELVDKATPESSVFVFARAADGPPMPVAVQKLTVADLPTTVILDDSQAMMPNLTLSSLDDVVIGARVSLSGEPTAQAGDLEAELQQVKASQTQTLNLVISKVR